MEYYTPSIEDIRVGYEYERYIPDTEEKYEKLTLKLNNLEQIQFLMNCYNQGLQDGWIRVPYLTKEQIEAEGWVEVFEGVYSKTVGEFHYYLDFSNGLTKITRIKDLRKDKTFVLFQGSCPSINELRYISKLVGIQ